MTADEMKREAVLACVREWFETELRNVDYSRATLRICVEALADGHPKRPSETEDSE